MRTWVEWILGEDNAAIMRNSEEHWHFQSQQALLESATVRQHGLWKVRTSLVGTTRETKTPWLQWLLRDEHSMVLMDPGR